MFLIQPLPQSMVGELTDSTNMAQAFGIMPVIWATGVTIALVSIQDAQYCTDSVFSPLIGGTLSHPYERFPKVFGGAFWHQYPYFLPCFASACFSGVSFLIALCFLKEVSHSTQTEDPILMPLQTVQKKPVQEPHEQSLVEAHSQATVSQRNTLGGAGNPHRDSTVGHGRDCSGHTLVEPGNQVIPFRDLLTGPVVLSIVNYGALAILDIALSALQPLFFSTPIQFGGLGFTPARIGLVLGLFGLLNGVFQGFCFARIVGTAGLRRTFMIGMAAFMVIFGLFPLINKMARMYGIGSKVWSVIVIQLCFWVIMDMAYGELDNEISASFSDVYPGCVFMYITSAAPTKRSLGSVNGMAQFTGQP